MESYNNINRDALLSVMRAHIRAGNWSEARKIGEFVRRGTREPETKEGDKRRVLQVAV